ncbi:probable 3',5'-cyclic phosphodiesterase pde-5 isoform X2 [Gordionus sp. m RMFG-2023]|uniref:probable 3',5'-cyclic phosphodiesterase pde-5 isoform X2 n=1 Tax=Gordionus sp. m RMFG-2023 TaxID=3053472 RepID=UPI0031FCE751
MKKDSAQSGDNNAKNRASSSTHHQHHHIPHGNEMGISSTKQHTHNHQHRQDLFGNELCCSSTVQQIIQNQGGNFKRKESHKNYPINLKITTPCKCGHRCTLILTSDQCISIETFLDHNPSFLQAYVLSHIKINTIRDWEAMMQPIDDTHKNEKPSEINQADKPNQSGISEKSIKVDSRSKSIFTLEKEEDTHTHSINKNRAYSIKHSYDSGAKMYLNSMDKLQTVLKEVSSHEPSNIILFQLISSISKLIKASISNLYIISPDGEQLEHKYCFGNNHKIKIPNQLITERKTATAFSAFTKQTILIKKYIPMSDDRFPEGVNDHYYEYDIDSVIIQPIISETEELLGIMEYLKFSSNNDRPFNDADIEIVGAILLFGLTSLHFLECNKLLTQQKRLNEFMLKVTSSIFQDMESIATLIFKIMKFGRKLVNADRASLFLVDRQNQELYASIFDVGGDQSVNDVVPIEKEKIRFPIGCGIAGSVASTGQIENIKNAYSDERFNRKVDDLTGYQTKTILCMPIYIRKEIIGVMQMVNKKDTTFNEADEKNFEAFAIYCGLALYHAQLYEKIYRSEKKYKVALEVLSYHITAGQDEVERLMAKGGSLPNDVTVEAIRNFDFDNDIDKNHNDLKPELVFFMYNDLFGKNRLNLELVARFILTVRKNYRNVPYHNWTHGFYVAHAAYVILKIYSEKFDHLESLALFIASLCHDLDHRGKNNTFMKETDTPLAAIYTTSTMEHHHFNQTVAILQQDGHNIIGDLSSTDYRKVLSLIKHCILATDLAQFFPFKEALVKRLDSEQFSWEDHHDRMLALAIIMTSCDLCASAKPWKFQQETVAVIMEEFFQQGDAEKSKGKKPIPLMDRDCSDQLPKNQVGFIKNLCIPCYEVLAKLLPFTSHLLEGARLNCERWSEYIKEDG